jgi:hypothetical protein
MQGGNVTVRTFGFLAALAVVLSICGYAAASDYPVREAKSIDGNILCHSKSDLIITESTGPCSGFTPPSKVAVGATFIANGKARKIGVVEATQVKKDYKDSKLELKKGDWYCVAAETPANLNTKHNKNALWLFIPRCELTPKPLSTLHIITSREFLKLPPDIQSVFVGGILEGMSFTLYGYYTPEYPEWVSCVRQKSLGDTTDDIVAFLRASSDFQESIASAVAQSIGKRCKR